MHTVPALTHQTQFQSSGVPDLLSPDAFDFAWTQYQGLMVEKLNLLTQGMWSGGCGRICIGGREGD